MSHIGFLELVPIQKVSHYRPIIFDDVQQGVGPNTQCYFDFVSFLQKWLLFPMIIGLITVFFNMSYEYTADDSPADFFYALFIMLWSIFFITQWEKSLEWKKVKESSGRS